MFCNGAPVAKSRFTAQYADAVGSDGQRKLLMLARRPVEFAGASIASAKLIALKTGVCSNWGSNIAAQPQPGPVSFPPASKLDT